MNAKDKRLKIIYLITDLKLGGAQTVLLHFLKRLNPERFTARVMCMFGGDLPVGEQLRQMGVEVTDIKMTAWWRLDALLRFYRLLRNIQPDILHASLFHASLLARLVGRLAKVPVILTWRQNINLGSQFRERLNRLTSRLDDGVIAVSELTRQAEVKASAIPPEKVEVIYNCVDTQRYKPAQPNERQHIRRSLGIPPEIILAGVIGRLHPQKGIKHLIDAYAQSVPVIHSLMLLVVGTGDLRKELETQVAAKGLQKHIIFTGPRTDIPQMLSALDIFILPSLWEGLPLALLEAMSAGIPSIASKVGGCSEAVIDGVTGLLVPPGDPQALSDALIYLARLPDLRRHMGNAGRAHVETYFAAGPLTKNLEKLYLRKVAEKRADR